jgi:nitronate monooxygenase
VLPLLRLVARRTGRPLVAAGGVSDGASLAGVLAAGAVAAQLGTPFLLCPEAGTSRVHREALARPGDTVLTRAFTGRRARALVNDFVRAHEAEAPAAYPHVLEITRPVLVEARKAGDAAAINLWAGQAHELARAVPAAQVVDELTAEAFSAIAALVERAHRWPG